MNESHKNNEKLFSEVCEECGSLNLYADDTTYFVANKRRQKNENMIRETLVEIEKFLAENKLHLNVGKTTLLEAMIPQKKGKTPGEPPSLQVEAEPGRMKDIVDVGRCRILGVNIQSNMTWLAHLESGEKAILPRVRRQLGALVHQGKKIPLRCRKTLATGLILSRMQYAIAIWGPTTDSQVRRAQVLLNKAVRWVTGRRKRTKISIPMKEVGWLTIKEMVVMQGCMLLWKIIHTR